ncbi:MAG: outer membrane lipoprotein carrier protein LolA [Deltaproteobacteria bacterium]|nr:outer membrane lipoprotein carrier protein LolA [Deltaproteobacteria bacterium]
MTGAQAMKRAGLFLLAVLLMAPLAAWADDFAELRRDAARISTISADFVQRKFMKILSRPLVSEGKFYFAKPDSIRWEYIKPVKSVAVSGKGVAKRYIVSEGKMVEDKTGGARVMKIVLDEVAGWMSGRFDSNPSFAASLKEGTPTVITLTPVEKSMSGMIEKIEIIISRKDMTIKSVRIIESATAETRIDFAHVVINKEINPSVFRDVP